MIPVNVKFIPYYLEDDKAYKIGEIRYINSKDIIKARETGYKTAEQNLSIWEVTTTDGNILVDEKNFFGDIVYYTFYRALYEFCYDFDTKDFVEGPYDTLYHLLKYGYFY